MNTHTKKTLTEVVKSKEFLNWCNEGMYTVFRDMFNIELKFESNNSITSHDSEISAVVAFMNSDIEAILQVSCARETVRQFAKILHGNNDPETTDFVFLGEVVNIVFGYLKEKMNLYDLYYDKCLPIVVIGQDHIILNLSKSDSITRNYSSPAGLFNLRIGFNQKKIIAKAS